MTYIKTYLSRIAAWLSQGINCVFLAGHHDMTVSARCYINRHNPRWNRDRKIINTLFFWQKDHCKQSYCRDVNFADSVKLSYDGSCDSD